MARWRLFAPALVVAVLGVASAPAARPDAAERLSALQRLLASAKANDEPGMWRELSSVSRQRLGPTLADFRNRGARGVRDGVAPFGRNPYRVIVNVDFAWDHNLGLVAIAGGREHGAFAVPVRHERGVWKVEIDPTFTVEAVRPLPFERVVRRTQLFAEIAAPHMVDGALMWFDAIPFETRQYWSPDQKHMSIWEEAPQPLRPGRHTIVAFAATRKAAAANAWTFTVRR